MRKQQAGFTFIELVMVIVILGILAATALPRFTDFSDTAATAAAKGLAGAVNAANAVNVSVCAMGHTNCVATTLPTTAGAAADTACATQAAGITQGWNLGDATVSFVSYTAAAGTTPATAVCRVDGDGQTGTTTDRADYTLTDT